MFDFLWNQQFMWNKDVYLIILGNFVFETQNTNIIRSFLIGEKTKKIFTKCFFFNAESEIKYFQNQWKYLEYFFMQNTQSEMKMSKCACLLSEWEGLDLPNYQNLLTLPG